MGIIKNIVDFNQNGHNREENNFEGSNKLI